MEKRVYQTNTKCRLCGSKSINKILDLGLMPLAGDYLLKNEVGKEGRFPLRIYFCNICKLVQVIDVINPDILFKNYRYLSSVSLSEHFSNYAEEMSQRFLKKGDFVVEIGSNDGVLLVPLKKLGVKVLGVDPAENVASIARERGIDTIGSYFGEKVARAISKTYGKADAIFANNVLAHINDMNDVLRGIKRLLKPTGILVFEVHYLADLVEKLQYDFFYNEHLNYYSLTSLIPFLKRYDLAIFDIERIPIHSGSIRVYAKDRGNRNIKVNGRVKKLVDDEKRMGLNGYKSLKAFASKVITHKKQLRKTLSRLQKSGKRLVGYGAAGRGNTLLSFCKIDSSLLEYIVDESPERHGRYTPGTHIQIVKPSIFRNNYPDYALLLAWSYQDEISEKEKEFIKRGGKFIIPFPKIKVVS